MALSYVSHLARRTVIDTRLRDDRTAGGRDFVEFGELLALGALSLTGLGVVAPAGAGAGIGGTGLALTSGAGGGGDAQGGDVLVNLGPGTGLGRSGMFIISGSATAGTSDHLSQNISAAMLIEMTYTPAQNDVGGSVEGLEVHLTTVGDGARMQGPSTEAVEFCHFWQATGTAGAIAYGGESTFSQDAASGTVGVATGWQGNIRGFGAGALTDASAFRATLGPFSGPVGTARGLLIAGPNLSGAGVITNLTGVDVTGFTKVTSAGVTLLGGVNLTGMTAKTPIEGGNTSGTITNRAYRATAGGGSAADGGTVNNYGFDLALPAASGSGGSTGHTRNVGLFITGNGGITGPVSNWAIYDSSTAQVGFAGPVGIGPVIASVDSVLTATALSLGDAWNVVLGTATGSMLGTGPTQKLGIWGATPAAQQVLATGAGKTVDNVIALLQSIGLARQS